MGQNFKPVEGEVWTHPKTRVLWHIHSITDDGWVRYFQLHSGRAQHATPYPLFTRPVLSFTSMYIRKDLTTVPATNIVPNGTRVLYHGSLTQYHGEMTVDGTHTEVSPTFGEYSSVRYRLRYGSHVDDFLYNVRPESFTAITEEENGHA